MSDKNNVKTGKAVQKSSLFSFFREVKAEVKKITLPSNNKEVWQYSLLLK